MQHEIPHYQQAEVMERIVKGIWIPLEIWQDKSLTWNEKILLMEIDSFTARGRECYISNEYIADLLGVSMRWAIKCLSHLIALGYVRMVKFDGRRRYVESAIQFNADMNNSSMQGGTSVQHTNISTDININNTLSNRGGTSHFQKPSLSEVADYCRERANKVDPEQFYNFYESNGWKVGKNPMKDWHAAVRTWEKREKEVAPRKREPKEDVFTHNMRVMREMNAKYARKEVDVDEQ